MFLVWAKAFTGPRRCKLGIWVRSLSKRVAVLLDALAPYHPEAALTQPAASQRPTRCHSERFLCRLVVRGVRQSSHSTGHHPRDGGKCCPSSAHFVVEPFQVWTSNDANSCKRHARSREYRTQHVRQGHISNHALGRAVE